MLAAKTDTRLQADMLQRLAAGGLQPIPEKEAFIRLLAILVYAGICEKPKEFNPAFNGKQYPDTQKH